MAESAPFSTPRHRSQGGSMDDEGRSEAIHQADELAFPMRLEAELAQAAVPLHQTIAELREQVKALTEAMARLQKHRQD